MPNNKQDYIFNRLRNNANQPSNGFEEETEEERKKRERGEVFATRRKEIANTPKLEKEAPVIDVVGSKEDNKDEAEDLVTKGLDQFKDVKSDLPEPSINNLEESVENLGDKVSRENKWLYIMENLHNMATAGGRARGAKIDSSMFQKMRDDNKQKLARQDKLAQIKPGASTKEEWIMKMDSMGRPIKMNKRTGEIIYADKPYAPKQPGQINLDDSAPKRREDESKEQYKARLQLWTAEQKDKTKPLTEGQGKAAGQITKMRDATSQVDNDFGLSTKGFEDLIQQKAQNKVWDSSIGQFIEFTGLTRRDAESEILSPKDQKAMVARRAWADAYVRSTSGAVVGERELSSDELGDKSASAMDTYFPQLGDSQETIKQKRRQRKAAEESVMLRTKKGSVPEAKKSPPKSVTQDGITYIWNGEKYIEEK